MTEIRPVHIKDANDFVTEHHRHHGKVAGAKFSVGLFVDGAMVGVAIAGRPVARASDDGLTLEITRICSASTTKNAITRLVAAIARAAASLGYRRVITYTLESETGVSMTACGFTRVAVSHGGSWDCPSRRRKDIFGQDTSPTDRKIRWERNLDARQPERDEGDTCGSR